MNDISMDYWIYINKLNDTLKYFEYVVINIS